MGNDNENSGTEGFDKDNSLNSRYKKGVLIINSYIKQKDSIVPFKVKFRIYRLSGIKPELIYYGVTDDYGKARISSLDFGYYRLIEVVDSKRIKPKYIPWNEFEINNNNLCIHVNIENRNRNANVKYEERKHETIKEEKDSHESQNLKNNIKGSIIVKSMFKSKTNEPLSGTEFSIFRVTNMKIQLVQSKTTNSNGIAHFTNLYSGKYLIVEKINKNIFNKPVYLNGQVVSLDKDKKDVGVLVINSLK